ncbi:hypothetical protein O6H91_Y141400 [Diphasiastrum complanatum]|nr:hypothetical protein O6H91_Y141400 [Diphasiastrum complanatum]KAJ7296142.1 hypothetical protein O6H91_Y141400 [Diphasiastrum complanatum]
MQNDVLQHLSSNSNPSDPALPLKLAKLEARMAGKSASSCISTARHGPESSATLATGYVPVVEASAVDSDNEGDGEFLIQPNPQKRKVSESTRERTLDLYEEISDGKMITIEDFEDDSNFREEFSKRRNSRGRVRGSGSRGRGVNKVHRRSPSPSYPTLANGQEDTSLKEEVAYLKSRCASLGEECDRLQQASTEYQHKYEQNEKDLKEMKEVHQQREQTRLKVVSDLLIAVAKSERQEARLRIRQDSVRIGNIGIMRAGTVMSEVWEDGQAQKDFQARLRTLMEQREAIEKERKLLKKKHTEKAEGNDVEQGIGEEEFLAKEEMYRCRLLGIKREEDAVLKDRDRYELEKARHVRELKRIRDEDGSRFNNFPILHKRYALLNLLGKGGFSEVYKAYDMIEYRYVACKLHSLNAQWSEEKKQSYIRHAIREYNIHKNLNHSNIVRLWDIFEIDHNTFCTVLEYCDGKDLDAVLKSSPILPEREARSILVQLFSGLAYLNKRSQRIIHYDLKPGNVLFDEVGVAKMTDFGLSKIVENEIGSQGMELTSQGAGTYWYLPPECFEISKTPLISSKVDVWSAGVLFFQMLYGKRPFGHEQTQERILREDTIVKANRVEFPSKPSVSAEAKDFIRRCLTYNQADRPDVLTAAQDPYLSYVKRKP